MRDEGERYNAAESDRVLQATAFLKQHQ